MTPFKALKKGQDGLEKTNEKMYGEGGFYDRLAENNCDDSEYEDLQKEKVDAAKKGGEAAGKALEAGKNLTEAAANGYGIPTSTKGAIEKATPKPKL